MRIPFLLACLLAAASVGAGAQTLKPGLWEIHNRMNNPQMDQAMAEMQKQLAGMPPEQRKQMEAMMAQRGVRLAPAAGGGMAVQVCMTKEMTERNEMPMQEGCRMTQNQRTGNTVKMAFTCTTPPSSGEGQVTLSSSEAYNSKMTVRTTAQGQAQTMAVEASGKWLRADCGNLKPVTPGK